MLKYLSAFKVVKLCILLAHYPNSIDKSCPNCKVRVNFWIKYQPWHLPIKLKNVVIIRRCKWGHLFQICVRFYNDKSKFLNWHVIPIEVFVTFYKSYIINQLWHLPIMLTSLVIVRRCKWGQLFEICVSFYNGQSIFLNWHVIPIKVSVTFYKSDIINQLWHLPIKLTSLVIIRRCKWGQLFEICVSFYSGQSKFLNWHVIPIKVSVTFYKSDIINQLQHAIQWHSMMVPTMTISFYVNFMKV